MVATRRSGRVTAGQFGWMNASGIGELADVGPGRFTGAKYVDILEEVLLPSVQAWLFPDNVPFYLIQDNSPIHTCRAVREWFARHPHITLLPHPPRSPDLNPMEHIWAAMVRKMPDLERPRTRGAVIAATLEAWEQLRRAPGQPFTAELVASMPRRLNAVLGAGGGYTAY